MAVKGKCDSMSARKGYIGEKNSIERALIFGEGRYV